MIEEKQGWQFILIGSSARKLKRAGIDLLASRALVRQLHPFMAAEIGAAFNLQQVFQFGLLPLVVSSQDPAGTLNAYVNLYLQEEVQAEGLVRNLASSSSFLTVMSFSHGSILNHSNTARECQVSSKLIASYLDVLHDLLLCFKLPVFSKRAKKATITKEKFYYFDVGVYRSLRAQGLLDKTNKIDGPGLEGLVIQHLRGWSDYQDSAYRLFYWRTRHGLEVDLIIYGKNGFWTIEIRHAQYVHKQDLKSLKAFVQDYPEATPLFSY